MHSQETENIPLLENMHTIFYNSFLILKSASQRGWCCIHHLDIFFTKLEY